MSHGIIADELDLLKSVSALLEDSPVPHRASEEVLIEELARLRDEIAAARDVLDRASLREQWNQRSSLLDQLHAGEQDYELVVPEALLEESRRTQRLFNLVMGCIAGISLLVGGIGVMNIMLVSVTERVHEIGIRMATGARRRNILQQFLTESVVVSALGGVVGVLAGVLIGLLLEIF